MSSPLAVAFAPLSLASVCRRLPRCTQIGGEKDNEWEDLRTLDPAEQGSGFIEASQPACKCTWKQSPRKPPLTESLSLPYPLFPMRVPCVVICCLPCQGKQFGLRVGSACTATTLEYFDPTCILLTANIRASAVKYQTNIFAQFQN